MEYKIEKEFGTKWVEGLRSGKFDQGKFKLYDKDIECYCALGIAAEVNGFNFIANGVMAVKNDKTLNLVDESVVSMKLYSKICEMNDHDKMCFTEIADWIETNVEFI